MFKTNSYFLGLSVTLILLTVNGRIEKKVERAQPYLYSVSLIHNSPFCSLFDPTLTPSSISSPFLLHHHPFLFLTFSFPFAFYCPVCTFAFPFPFPPRPLPCISDTCISLPSCLPFPNSFYGFPLPLSPCFFPFFSYTFNPSPSYQPSAPINPFPFP